MEKRIMSDSRTGKTETHVKLQTKNGSAENFHEAETAENAL
jgi:hypothetical protein